MTGADIVAATTISEVFVALGGDAPKHGRAKAFWRTGADNPQAISLNDGKGAWFDHRDNAGGGILSLIQHVRSCDRGAALRWLADFVGVPLDDRPMTLAQRRNYARADALAQRLADFARGLDLVTEQTLREVSDWLTNHDIDSTLVLAELHSQAHALRIATAKDIARTWHAMHSENPAAVATVERIGRGDREHAEVVTWAIVELLARSKGAIAA